MSACGACQSEGWASWPLWSTNCSIPGNLIATEAFPSGLTIPPETVIPKWAAQDPQAWTSLSFNVTEARRLGSTDADLTVSTTSATSAATSASTTSTQTTSGSGSSSPPVGPIVGGVVGGVLGVLLIGVLAIFLLCPGVFRRKQKAATNQAASTHDLKSYTPNTHTPHNHTPGVSHYETSTISSAPLVVPNAARPPMLTQYSSSNYSIGTSVDQQQNPTPPIGLHPGSVHGHASPPHSVREVPMGSPPMNNTLSIYSNAETIMSDTATPSIRSFFTRVTARPRHSHTTSDTSVMSVSSLIPRPPPGLFRTNRAEDQVVPYVLPPANGTGAASSSTATNPAGPQVASYPADRKQRPNDLQYTPPPPQTPLPQPMNDALPIQPIEHPYGPPGVPVAVNPGILPTRTPVSGILSPTAEEAYGFRSMIDGEIDRRTNMSPANASSILEAAPPYAAEEGGVRGPRRTPRLPDVAEYPEEKARFTNARGNAPAL
ncbi:hypothetical protein CPB86DRAFT_810873 [Serendipita vermifera]|nr:hypothetical protein CPB86DRAFT_810873 [Serendipita vermifera]